jgi:hypothetical protein
LRIDHPDQFDSRSQLISFGVSPDFGLSPAEVIPARDISGAND